jgi:hypothetical protein
VSEQGSGARVASVMHVRCPAGLPEPVYRQVLTSDRDREVSNVPMCVWGDDNTGASVGVVTDENVYQDPKDVDLKKVARMTLQVRDEMREPIG